jgi:hypothetical protein
MQTIKFTSMRGTELYGKVGAEKRIRRSVVKFVYKLGRIYAILDGQSIDETKDTDDFGAFVERVEAAI